MRAHPDHRKPQGKQSGKRLKSSHNQTSREKHSPILKRKKTQNNTIPCFQKVTRAHRL